VGKHGRGSGVPHPIDVLVGKRIRARRLFLGMSEEALANRLGVTFQQVQKYELSANRVSASRLSVIADALRVPISFFFANSQVGHEGRRVWSSLRRSNYALLLKLRERPGCGSASWNLSRP
jgi:transcriptional regulator with XRE-family HTH domain